MHKRISLFLTILLVLSTLAGSFHYHADGTDHPGCSICLAHHQQADSSYIFSSPKILREFTETLFERTAPAAIAKSCFTPANSRAPPV
jgi:hypothetical protein